MGKSEREKIRKVRELGERDGRLVSRLFLGGIKNGEISPPEAAYDLYFEQRRRIAERASKLGYPYLQAAAGSYLRENAARTPPYASWDGPDESLDDAMNLLSHSPQ
jgi:sugar phosphate isomerase/epimerase